MTLTLTMTVSWGTRGYVAEPPQLNCVKSSLQPSYFDNQWKKLQLENSKIQGSAYFFRDTTIKDANNVGA